MTTRRTLTITMTPDWRTALRRVAKSALADSYQGETLNFESPGAFFGRLTERRWALVTALQGQGAMAVLREFTWERNAQQVCEWVTGGRSQVASGRSSATCDLQYSRR